MRSVVRFFTPFGLALGLTLLLVLGLARPARAADITVNSLDDVDDGTCDGSHCSLREAIDDANSNIGPDTILFDPSLEDQTIVITDTSSLTLQGDDDTTIDGDVDGDGDADITLTYNGAGTGISGIRIRSSNNVIKNLIIENFNLHGVYIQSHKSGNDYTVDDNLIYNTTVVSNTYYGVFVEKASVTSSADGNRIQESRASGNRHGIWVTDATNTEILTNVIGLNAAGTAAHPNTYEGLRLNGALSSTIRANIISGNGRNGLLFEGGAYGNVIAGNKIGVDSAGATAIPNGFTYNRDGIQCYGGGGGGHDNVIGGTDPADANIIAGNTRAGVFIDGSTCYDNQVYGNYVGTNPAGDDLGNGSLFGGDSGDAGIEIEDGAHDNVIGGLAAGQSNVIRFNLHGVRLSGFNGAPQRNQLINNDIISNDIYGVVNQLTHRNAFFVTPALGDNWIAHNVISDSGSIGIFNWGASPHIVTNTITYNGRYGIANRVYFSETNHAEDLLSMPYIAGNLLDANADIDIFSRDTVPLNKATVHSENDFGTVGGDARVSHRWFGAVEVLSGTTTLDDSVNLTVTISTFAAERTPCPKGAAYCVGTDYDQVNAAPEQGIWGPTGIDYVDIENWSNGDTTWFELRESEVDAGGNVITYSKMLVTVEGDRIGAAVFSFDGISTTETVDPDYQLPFCENTGITSDPDHSLCRYQIAQVVVEPPDGDADGDGIPDDVEGGGDADGDGTPNFLDDDSDGDGIPDSVEGDGDADGDGTPNFLDDDSDGDGIPDSVEGDGDADGDGTPNFLDDDSDGDGIPDAVEGADDADGDGTPNFLDEDSDGDGIPDAVEGVKDTDGDGTPDYLDEDSDGDGIPDMDEAGCTDSNGDGQADSCPATPPDEDGDGIPDYAESNTNDGDGDGTPDYMDDDSDGDGILDDEEWDGCDPPGPVPCDADADGIPDYLESNTRDTDGDGLPDYLDDDSDGDGVLDGDEGAYTDTDGDGVPDYLENNLAPDGSAPPSYDTDPDQDGNPPNDDVDADGDGIPDATEFYPGCTAGAELRDTDGDGVPNCADWDADGDGIPNFLDQDSDGDGVPDSVEGTGDANGNGIPDYLDPPYTIFLPLVTRYH